MNADAAAGRDDASDFEEPNPGKLFNVSGLAKQPTVRSDVNYTIFVGKTRLLIVTLAIVTSWMTTISANIYFPALTAIANDLGVSKELVSLTVTSYMVAQGLSPPIWSAIADTYGRRVAYFICLSIFIGATAGASQTKHYYQLLVLRCIQSTGSASTLAIGAGILGDITTRSTRGSLMGIYQGLALLMNAIGPVVGGVLAQTLDNIFTFLAIFAGTDLIFLFLFLPETLRSLVGNGSIPPTGLSKSLYMIWQQRNLIKEEDLDDAASTKQPRKSVDWAAPFRILFSREAFFAITFLTVSYTCWQVSIVAASNYFAEKYGLNELEIGLTFIANGVGCMAGSFAIGWIMDRDYLSIKKKHVGQSEDLPIELARLRNVYFLAVINVGGLLVFGWTIDKTVNIAVPIIATFVIAFASTSIQSAVSTLLVDLYPRMGASATASLNLARCLVGAGGTSAILPLASALSVGGAFSLMAGLHLVSTSFVFVQIRYGPRWRKARRDKELPMPTREKR